MQNIAVSLPADSIYVTGTVNGVEKTWTNTYANVWETTAYRAEDETYVVALTVINAVGTTTTQTLTLYYGVLNLITDRTASDVNTVIRLSQKGWSNMTEDEQELYLSSMKGAYNATDLNRVGAAVRYIADRFNASGYSVDVSPKTDWSMQDYPTSEKLSAYLSNVRVLRSVFDSVPGSPEVPEDMDGFTWQEANNIEQILVDLDFLLNQMSLAWFYSGEIQSGEV